MNPATEAVFVIERGGADLQDGLCSAGAVPEFLRALDAVVDLFDERFNHRRRHRQPRLAIFGVFHARLVVHEIRDGCKAGKMRKCC
jgi:hypothetical protein